MPNPHLARDAFARPLFMALAFIVSLPVHTHAASLVLGDSIAKGAGAALHVETVARKGAASCAILGFEPSGHFDRVVISAGVNDAPGPCIDRIRDAIDADEVVWILPPPINSARAAIRREARVHGDKTVSYAPGPDRLHPRSYPALARDVLAAW